MARCTFQLLGGWRMELDGEDCTEALPRGKARLLLVYLALAYGDRPSRKQIAFDFWPDSSEKQALSNLRKLIHDLREHFPRIDRCLTLADSYLRWNREVEFHSDVRVIEQAVRGGAPDELRHAETLYRGGLLPGIYEEWLDARREMLAQSYRSLLERLIAVMESRRDYASALIYANKLLLHDRLREETYRTLMRLHALNRDAAGAATAYRELVRALGDELGIEPSDETNRLMRSLQRSAESHASAAPDAHAPALLPLVGRIGEWETMRECWRRASAGRPAMLVLQGEAGIGKTRLAEELRDWTERQGIAAAMAGCFPSVRSLSYTPVTAWLRSLPMPKLHPSRLTELARLLPELHELHPGLPKPEPVREKWQLNVWYEAIERMVLASQPALLVLDNIQWCDNETLRLLAYLLRSESDAKLLVAATMRTDESSGEAVKQLLSGLRIERKLTEIPLHSLSEDETKRLMAAVVGEGEAARLAPGVYAQTGGNPLFIVETVREWRTDGKSGELRLAPAARSVVEHRVAKLDPALRRLAATMAAALKPVTAAFMAAITETDEESVLERLEQLAALKVVRETEGGLYDFTHDLIRDTAYASHNESRRRICHGRIARCLARFRRDRPEICAAETAMHYELAGMEEEAVVHYEQAASAAERIFANETRIKCYRKLLLLLPDDRVLPIVLKLGEAHIVTGNAEEAERTYNEWLARCGHAATFRERSLCDAALGDCLRLQGRYGEARRRLERALDYFALTEDHEGLSLVYGILGYLDYFTGRYDQARHYLMARLELPNIDARTRDDCRFYGCLGFLSYDIGEYGQAIGWFKRQIALATDIRDRRYAGDALGGMALSYLETGDMDAAYDRIAEKLEISRSIGARMGFATGIGMLGKYYEMLGADESAEACIAFCLEEAVRLKDWHIATVVLGIQGCIRLKQGRSEEAAAMFERSIRLARKTVIPFYECEGLYFASELLQRRNQWSGALAAAEEALPIAIRLNRGEMQIRLRIRIALLLAATGRLASSDASDLLERLLDASPGPPSEAAIRFAIWKLSPESPELRTEALRLNELLFRRSGRWEYYARCREMGAALEAAAARPLPRCAAEAGLHRTVSAAAMAEIDRYASDCDYRIPAAGGAVVT